MSMDGGGIDRELLHDYVDGQLDPESRLQLARHLGETPEEAAVVDSYRAQNEALHQLYGAAAEEPVPEHLTEMVQSARLANDHARPGPVRERARGMGPLAACAVMLLALGLGITGGWWLRGVQDSHLAQAQLLESFVQQAISAYTLYTETTTVGATSDPTGFTEWFKSQFDADISVPEFTQAGFELQSTHILPMAFGAAGNLVYANESGARIAVYVQIHTGDGPGLSLGSSPAYAGVGDELSVFYWTADNVSYALVGPMPRDDLSQLIEEILPVPKEVTPEAPEPPPEAAETRTRA